MTAFTLAYAHAYQTICLGMLFFRCPSLLIPVAQAQVQTLFCPMIVLFLKNLAMIIVGGLSFQMVVPVLLMVKPLLDGE